MSVSEFKFDPRSGDVTVERSNGQVDNFSLADAVTRNSSGQLVGPDGQVVGGGGGSLSAVNRTIWLGDSMIGRSNRSWYSTGQVLAMSRTNGVVTVQITGNGLTTGSRVRVASVPQAGFNGDFRVTRIDVDNFSYPSPGPDQVATRSEVMVMSVDWISTQGPAVWCDSALGGALTLVRNAGVNGETSAQILARMQTDVLAYPHDFGALLCGYNDLISGFSAAQTRDNILAIADLWSKAGVRSFICPPIPMGATAPMYNAVNVEKFRTVARDLRRAAQMGAIPGMVIVDGDLALVDRNNTTNPGIARAGVLSDQIHTSVRGAQVLGYAYADKMRPFVTPIDRLPGSYADVTLSGTGGRNVFKAGPWVTTGGTLTPPSGGTLNGAAAANVRIARQSGTAGAAVASVVTGDDGVMRQQLAVTPAGAEMWRIDTTDGAAVAALVTAGERRRFVCEFELTGVPGSTFRSFNLQARVVAGGVTTNVYVTMPEVNNPINQNIPRSTWVSEAIEIPAGVSAVEWRLELEFSGAGSEVVARIGRCGFELES